MQSIPSAVFLIDLLQDVSILRPLVFISARDFRFDTLLLVSTKFTARDTLGVWQAELDQISAETGARLEYFADGVEARQQLAGFGLLFSASESHVPHHSVAHGVFRHAPAGYMRVTLQHGFECVGLRHSADHVRTHGVTASFAADIVCSWAGPDHLESLAQSQRSKILVTGPTSVLQMDHGGVRPALKQAGLVCENLHSVRFRGERQLKTEFMETFASFTRKMATKGRAVTLRTHPGGQYVLKNKVQLPPNVREANAPMYRLDLRQFSYGISAPSTILIDLVLAGIPIAVWRDSAGRIDAKAYDGLSEVTSSTDWIRFAEAAEQDPGSILDRQARFLTTTGIVSDPRTVFFNYARLFQAARRMQVRPPCAVPERERILFVANSEVPTLQLSFEKPLAPLVARGEVSARLLTEQQLRAEPGLIGDSSKEGAWIEHYLDSYSPSTIIFCRYSGPAYRAILEWAVNHGVPVIYHIDDDLLAVPPDIGARKFAVHNDPGRIAAVTTLLNSADVVYASTGALKAKLLSYFPALPVTAGKIYCSGSIVREPSRAPARKLGYMASADHAHNLKMILPAIERLLDRHPHLEFELFGSIPVPDALKRFGDRIVASPPIGRYDEFLTRFAERGWDIGICPLARIEFNLMKANTKWVEYTSTGVAVVASRGTVYDDCCADGCGILADSAEEWFSALDLLVNNVDERVAIVERAQVKLERDFGLRRLREQVMEILAQGHAAASARSGRERKKEKVRVCQP